MKFIVGLLVILSLIGCGKQETISLDDNGSDIVDIYEHIYQLEKKTIDLEASVFTLDGKLTSLTTTADLLSIDLDLLESILQKEISNRVSVDEELNMKIVKANRSRMSLALRFERFRRYQSAVNARASRLIRNLERENDFQFIMIQENFLRLDNRISKAESKINSRIDELSIADIEGLDKDLAKIRSQIESIGVSDVDGLENTLHDLRSSLGSLNKNIKGIEHDIEIIDSSINDIEYDIAKLQRYNGDCSIFNSSVHSHGYNRYYGNVNLKCGDRTVMIQSHVYLGSNRQ